MGNCINIEHAIHNEKVCNYLDRKPEFVDWIITTAFYSSLHYIRHKILPYVYEDKSGNIKTYDDFESLFNNFKKEGEGRHGFQKRFVEENMTEIRFEYQKLHELCQNARYYNYKFQREDSIKAREYLQIIKKNCYN
ncbi:MAG: hypothetical protein LBO74_01305 [Candidatus Symbiothrix sp.]|jgi:hypothetical protein|nr:hypothetical protein [Candidatus Symbiothrix sp.]